MCAWMQCLPRGSLTPKIMHKGGAARGGAEHWGGGATDMHPCIRRTTCCFWHRVGEILRSWQGCFPTTTLWFMLLSIAAAVREGTAESPASLPPNFWQCRAQCCFSGAVHPDVFLKPLSRSLHQCRVLYLCLCVVVGSHVINPLGTTKDLGAGKGQGHAEQGCPE